MSSKLERTLPSGSAPSVEGQETRPETGSEFDSGRDLLVVGLQYGDEGKGRVVDNLAAAEDSVVVRYSGGPNAGHTVVADGVVQKFHGIPSGFAANRPGLIGGGCVVDPTRLLGELTELEHAIPSYSLSISVRAHVIMPYHRVQDEAEEIWRRRRWGERSVLSGQLGTTGRGVGPAYADKASRIGFRLGDLLLAKDVEHLVRRNCEFKRRLIAEALDVPELATSLELDPAETLRAMALWREQLTDLLVDDDEMLTAIRHQGGRRLIFEGAQAFGIDLEYGRFPHVSSSVNSLGGAVAGGARAPFTIGVAKCYTIAVGEGAMPSEIHGPLSDTIVDRGREFGTTTGRRRRIGWLDLPLMRRAVRVNDVRALCLTNLDVVAGLPDLAVALSYGENMAVSPFLADDWSRANPVLERYDTWPEIGSPRAWEDLPGAARAFVQRLEEEVGVGVEMVTFGRDRSAVLGRGALGHVVPTKRLAVPA